jgi:hypothetical protein
VEGWHTHLANYACLKISSRDLNLYTLLEVLYEEAIQVDMYTRLHKYVTLPIGRKYCIAAAVILDTEYISLQRHVKILFGGIFDFFLFKLARVWVGVENEETKKKERNEVV